MFVSFPKQIRRSNRAKDHTKKEMMAVSNIQKRYRPRWLYILYEYWLAYELGLLEFEYLAHNHQDN